jgi:hypothetical protein
MGQKKTIPKLEPAENVASPLTDPACVSLDIVFRRLSVIKGFE